MPPVLIATLHISGPSVQTRVRNARTWELITVATPVWMVDAPVKGTGNPPHARTAIHSITAQTVWEVVMIAGRKGLGFSVSTDKLVAVYASLATVELRVSVAILNITAPTAPTAVPLVSQKVLASSASLV